ncbi:MAG TPA: RluA family pseudouridine synthase [Virgibacillus sp.]|nr:RluA family pseudouridine synthase [Virgibacillus sp.]
MSKQFKMIHRSADDRQYKILSHMELLPFLYDALSDRSRNSVKSMLRRGQIFVNHKSITQFNHKLKHGDHVEIVKNEAAKRKAALIGLRILYEDQDIIVVHKEAGLLSIAAGREGDLTAHAQLMTYVRKKHPRNRIFVVHRLDRDTSGVMMFAKSDHIQRQLQDNWHQMAKERTYIALVEGRVKKGQETITSYLKETKTHMMYSTNTPNGGLRAVTHYKKLRANDAYSLLEVSLETGRKNQIRVHMKDIGHPVVGDKKYGSTKNPMKRLGLHAKTLAFVHPRTNKFMRITSDVPKNMLHLVK